MSFYDRATRRHGLRRLDAQVTRLVSIEAGLAASWRADCPTDQANLAMVRAERERVERERARVAGGPRDTATLSLFVEAPAPPRCAAPPAPRPQQVGDMAPAERAAHDAVLAWCRGNRPIGTGTAWHPYRAYDGRPAIAHGAPLRDGFDKALELHLLEAAP